jgi:hypothetical protein
MPVKVKSALFYAAGVIVLAIMATKSVNDFASTRTSREFNDQSEAIPIVLLFCAYIQFVWQAPSQRTRSPWPVAIGLAAASWLTAWLLLESSLPSSYRTWNECFVAVGGMILYANIPRPFRMAPLATAVVIVLIGVFNDTHFVTTQSESLVPLALMPMAFDWADRTILDPEAEDTPGRRAVWCLFLLAVPLIARLHVDLGSMHDVFRYERRATEGMIGLLLVHVYFSYWLGDEWRHRLRRRVAPSEPQPV